MRLLIRACVLLVLFGAGYYGLERLIVYPLDPRQIAPSDARLTERRFGNMVVWTAPARDGEPTVMYLHGNAGHLSNRIPRFERLMDRGYGVVAPGYRGGSGSSGWPTEAAIMSDIRAFYLALTAGEITGTPTVPIIYGESIGAAVAVQLNASYMMDHGAPAPRAIVLEAPFTSLRDVAEAVHPLLPLATGLMLSRWNSLDYAPMITQPLLVLHGTEDNLIPPEMGRRILDAAKSRDKEYFPVERAGHIDVWKASAQKRLYRFLATH